MEPGEAVNRGISETENVREDRKVPRVIKLWKEEVT